MRSTVKIKNKTNMSDLQCSNRQVYLTCPYYELMASTIKTKHNIKMLKRKQNNVV